MRQILLFFCLMGLGCLNLNAQSSVLKFNKAGEFKIVQFTDVHFKYGNPASDIALERIDEVLESEQPDLVVFTGDVIYAQPADSGMLTVLERVAVRKDRGEADSPDYSLTVKSSDGKGVDRAILYFFDTHSYSRLKDVKGYDWLTFEQVENYRKQSTSFTAANGGQPLPALAFFHIPLPEYNLAASAENAIFKGTRMEKACAPALNTGMFTAMKEAGDVMGMFAGHDHDNDYTVMWHGILLGYGRYTGGNTVYNHLPNGARVIVLKEGKRTFDTWIDLAGGKQIDSTVYPDSYVKK